jgi:hypothetical protein
MSRPLTVGKWLLASILLAGAYFRASGLFRGLERGVVFHPDSPKQVRMLDNYLHGNYIQYYGSRFYDGYPYGLNRVDEMVIRGAAGTLLPAVGILDTETKPAGIPSRQSLFYWGRLLRMLYGLGVVVLVYATVVRLSGSVRAALIAAALYALSPIGVAVSHSVTGDIGVDLFLALAVYCLAVYTTGGRVSWMAAFAAACGMAFACKFQGLLGLWMGAIMVLAGAKGAPRPLRLLWRQGSIMAAAFVCGLIVLNPALLLQPDKTWRNMRINFSFIRDYGVPAEFLAQPLPSRLWFGLSHNSPLIIAAIGYGMVLLSAAALLFSLWMLWRGRHRVEATRMDARQCWMFAAVASFPWMALFLATALKPEVQPFHFSFLLPVMAVAIGVLVAAIRNPVWRPVRLAGYVLLPLCLVELFVGCIREDFFWRRPETAVFGDLFSGIVFGHPYFGTVNHRGSRVIKSFYAEPAQLSVFRNRPSGLAHPDAEWWRSHGRLPVPTLPFPVNLHWIFMDGPVFPRNDRMFTVPAGGRGISVREGYGGAPLLEPTWSRNGFWTEKTLVFSTSPAFLQIGLRTGRWPARCTVEVRGAASQAVFLPPHAQVILPLPVHAKVIGERGDETSPERFLVPIRLRAQLGPVWATVLEDAAAEANYRRFGPEGNASAATDVQGFADHLKTLLYLGSDTPYRASGTPACLPGSEQPLAAGPYILEADVVNAYADEARLRFYLRDVSGGTTGVKGFEVCVPPQTVTNIVWRFEKRFAPYDAELMVAADPSPLSILSWTLRPDAAALPSWQAPPAGAIEDGQAERCPETTLNVNYPGIGVLQSLLIPDVTEAGKPFPYAIRFDLDPGIPHKTFHESVFFIHILNAEEQLVMALDYPLRKGSYPGNVMNWQQAKALPPGAYRVVGGICNERTRNRFRFEMQGEDERRLRSRAFVMKTSLVVP